MQPATLIRMHFQGGITQMFYKDSYNAAKTYIVERSQCRHLFITELIFGEPVTRKIRTTAKRLQQLLGIKKLGTFLVPDDLKGE